MLVPLIASRVHSGSEQFAQLFPEAGVWKPSSHLMKAISMKDFRPWFASEWAEVPLQRGSGPACVLR